MAAIPTLAVFYPDREGTVIINACDFDPSIHHACDDVGTTGATTDDGALPPQDPPEFSPAPPAPVVPASRRKRRGG